MEEKEVRHWKIFPGKVKFFCDGRIQTSTNWWAIPGVLALIIVPSCFHLGFDIPFLIKNVSVALPIFGFIVFLLSLANYIMCAFTDPGFLPRATADEAFFIEKQNNISVDLSGSYYPNPKNKTVIIKGCEYEMKFCTTCKFYRPPRVVHCGTCNMCVERFDHHCPWVSNCVGKRNYKSFYLFLVFTSIMAVYGLAASATALGLRIKTIKPIGDALRDSVVSILLGLYAIVIGLNMIGMASAHTFYLINEKTTNERLKIRWKTKDNKSINPFSRGNFFLNFWYMMFRSIEPYTINYRENLNESYYHKQVEKLRDLRRKNKSYLYSSELLIPIPGIQLYSEIKNRKKNDFEEESQVLNDRYMDINKKIKAEEINEKSVDDSVANFFTDPDVNFYYKGYEKNKNYINLKLRSDRGAYWRFLYENKINNIVILDDRHNENLFNKKYEFLFDRNQANRFGQAENLNIEFGYAYRYSNFTINIFYLNPLDTDDQINDNELEVRIYRFWTFDSESTLPNNSSYYVKMIQIINFNNPQLTKPNKNKFSSRRKKDYPQDNFNDLTNYVIHSDEPSRMYSFMIYDHILDEIKATNHFSTENAFKMFRSIHKPDKLFNNSFKLNLDEYLFAYIAGFCSIQLTSDIQLIKVKEYVENLFKPGIQTKYPIIKDHFKTLMDGIHGERLIRSYFTHESSLPDNFFNFSLFDINDFTVIIIQQEETFDQLIEYIILNQVELMVSVNFPINLKNNIKKNELKKYQELEISLSPSTSCLKQKKKIEFSVYLQELSDLKSKNFDYSLKYTEIDLNLNLIKREAAISYDDRSTELVSCFLNQIIHERKKIQERMILVTNEVNLAAILAVSFLNYRQAQIEGTINVSMSCQTVLSKIPKLVGDQFKNNDFSSNFKQFFSIQDFELVQRVSVRIANNINEYRTKRKEEKEQEKFISL